MSGRRLPFPLLDPPDELASCNGWSEEIYRDLLAYRSGRLDRGEFDAKYVGREAILVMDLTGFTVSCFNGGELHAILRILDAQKVCMPVLRERGASLIRAFADDLVAAFDDVGRALDAAFELHRRVALFGDARTWSSSPYPGMTCCSPITGRHRKHRGCGRARRPEPTTRRGR